MGDRTGEVVFGTNLSVGFGRPNVCVVVGVLEEEIMSSHVKEGRELPRSGK